MTPSRYSIAALATAGIVWVYAQGLGFIPPTPETQSKFYQQYNPVPSVDAAGLACYSNGEPGEHAGWSGGETHAAGDATHDIRHTKSFEPSFCGSAVKNAALMTSIENSAVSSLQSAACAMSEIQLSTADGFSLKYRCGERTTGTMTAKIVKEPKGPRSILKVEIDEHRSITP